MDNWLFKTTEIKDLAQLDNFSQKDNKLGIVKSSRAYSTGNIKVETLNTSDSNHILEPQNNFKDNQPKQLNTSNFSNFERKVKFHSLGEIEEEHACICSCGDCHSQGINSSVEHDGHIHMFDSLGNEFIVLGVPENLEASTSNSSISGIVNSADIQSSGVPILSSNPDAQAKIYLDFDGHITKNTAWNAFTDYKDIVTPAYSADSDKSKFSQTELDNIYEIWQRVSEDFAPFNIDVTTVEPASFGAKEAVRIVIGGHSKDWYGSGAGGIAYVNSWKRSYDLPAFVFEDNLGSSAKNIAEAVSHETGHTLGLRHQSLWDDGKKKTEYYSGSGKGDTGWAPIMGNSYSKNLTTWSNGTNANGDSQGDIEIIANASNGFGFKADDHGNTLNTATVIASDKIAQNGIITTTEDIDVFKFNTSGGEINLQVDVAKVGANLDVVAELWNSQGEVVLRDNKQAQLDATIKSTVAAGTYYLAVKSNGEYGRVGQYSISGTVPIDTNNNDSDTLREQSVQPVENINDVEVVDGDDSQSETEFMGEFGRVDSIDHNLQTITFKGNYDNPVVFAGPISYKGGQTATVRITDIDSNQFSVQIQETNNLDGWHKAESFSYMVLEAGVWQLSDGTVVEVGKINTAAGVGDSWANISYNGQFDNTPVVLTNIQSQSGADFMRTRQQNATSKGVAIALEKEEALRYTDYKAESVGYLAIEAGSGSWSGYDYQASGEDSLTHQWYEIDFGGSSYDSTPQFWSNIASYNGRDSSGLRYSKIDAQSVSLKIEEDTSKDQEENHVSEQINWLAIEGSGSLEATAVMNADQIFMGGAISADLSSDVAGFDFSYSTIDF